MFRVLSKVEENGKIVGINVSNGKVTKFISKEYFGDINNDTLENAVITKDLKVKVKSGFNDIPIVQRNNSIVLYHGSVNIIKKPVYGYGTKNNDYGKGFYCTEDLELAREWACKSESSGYVSKYFLDLKGLKVLKLGSDSFEDILKWIAILVSNRRFDIKERVDSKRNLEFLLKTYLIKDYRSYDVIIGYRADDSYFSFAKGFINGDITVEDLSKAMKLGGLGYQVVIISRKAFNCLKFIGSEKVFGDYHKKFSERDTLARSLYKNLPRDGRYTLTDIRWRYEHAQ